MFARSSISHWIARFIGGITLIVAAGCGLPRRILPADPMNLFTFGLGFAGFLLALHAVTPLVRFVSMESRVRREWTRAATEAFAQASLPRRVYYLLAAVAQADGPITAVERDAVRRFVLARFLDPSDSDALRAWEEHTLRIGDVVTLAAKIAPGLDPAERDSLFCWCCLVAFADGSYRAPEHQVLQDVAKGLEIDALRARMLFHLARAQFLRGGTPSEPPTPTDARTRALAVLGLPPDATPDTIRKRHRQLVRQFHPDAQPNLGPVAQREATERFHEIQRAYEMLAT